MGEWIRGQRLGQGSFATVDLAMSIGGNEFLPPLMAVKSCSASKLASLGNEKVTLDELKGCPHVIRCFGESFSWENGEKVHNLLLEYAVGGSLAEKLKNSDGLRLPESDIRRYAKGLVEGIGYIHQRGYVHCDIKPQNILLCPDTGVKIADFGMAKRAGGGVKELRGTPMYMSPEMVCDGEQESAADIWALGCVVVEMASGSPAWRCSDMATLFPKIRCGGAVPEIPASLSEEGKDFIGKCFIKDPAGRWTAKMLLNHPFVREIDAVEKPPASTSSSPRCPLEWCAITSLPSSPDSCPDSNSVFSGEQYGSGSSISASERIQRLIGDELPDWSISSRWINIR